MGSPKRHQIVTLAPLYRATIVREGTQHHRHREPFQGFAQGLCDRLADRQQPSLEDQGRVELPLHRIGGPCPPRGHLQEPFGQRDRGLEAPAPPIPLADLAGRQHLRSEDMGPLALPRPLPQDRDQAQPMGAGVRVVLAHLEDLVAIIRALAPHRHGTIRGLFPHAGATALLLVRKVIAP
jgi:hypothetical protein